LGGEGVIGGGAEAGFLCLLDGFGGDADDVGAAGVELGDLGGLHVEAGDAETLFAEEQGEREADVAHADDADAGFAGFHFVLQGFEREGGGCGHVFLILNRAVSWLRGWATGRL